MINGLIVITGSNGLLGQKLVALFLEKGIDFIATSKGENRNPDCPADKYHSLDITIQPDVQIFIKKKNPKVVINTAAMTNVDACEDNKEICYTLNVKAVEYLWEACKEYNIHFIHYSTDFIFDGKKLNYSEKDMPNPLSVYGQSKLDSEKILTEDENENWTIIRTIIVYGLGNNLSRSNIFVWAKSELEKGNSLTIVDDQYRAPTYAPDLAKATFEIVDKHVLGVYNVAGPETLNMFQIIQRLTKWLGEKEDKVTAIDSSTLNQKASRPPKTGFNLGKINNAIDYNPFTLEQSFDDMWN